MKNRQEGEILEEFLRVTKAEPVRPTEEDEIERLELEAEAERRQAETEKVTAVRVKRQMEEAALKEVQDRIAENTADV